MLKLIYKIDQILLVSIFIAFISIPFVVNIYREDYLISTVEKRYLSQKPSFPANTEELKEFPQNLDAYYSDQFGFRNFLTKIYFNIENRFRSGSVSDHVTFGKDGWLFLGSIRPGYRDYGDPIGDAMNINLYTDDELVRFSSVIQDVNDWLLDKDIHFVYVIAPNKHSIYFDKLPDYIEKKGSMSATDQVAYYLDKYTSVVYVELRTALKKARTEGNVYYQSDSHWNHYGANIAQYEIMKSIEHYFPGRVSPRLLGESDFNKVVKNNGDLANHANISNYSEPSPQPVFNEMCEPVRENSNSDFFAPIVMTCEGQDLSVLVYRDSFFTYLQPYFSRRFGKATYVWEDITFESLQAQIEASKPDIVIYEVVERNLPYIPYWERPVFGSEKVTP